MKNEPLPPVIIVELADGNCISAELVKVVGDSSISVAMYREIELPGGRLTQEEQARLSAYNQNVVAMVEKAMETQSYTLPNGVKVTETLQTGRLKKPENAI